MYKYDFIELGRNNKLLGSESISDGLPFLQLGYVKEDTEEGLKVVMQNRKGFN